MDFPKLFEACLDPGFPLLQHLDYMLQMRDKLAGNQLSVEDADKEVYGTLNRQYMRAFMTEEELQPAQPDTTSTAE